METILMLKVSKVFIDATLIKAERFTQGEKIHLPVMLNTSVMLSTGLFQHLLSDPETSSG